MPSHLKVERFVHKGVRLVRECTAKCGTASSNTKDHRKTIHILNLKFLRDKTLGQLMARLKFALARIYIEFLEETNYY